MLCYWSVTYLLHLLKPCKPAHSDIFGVDTATKDALTWLPSTAKCAAYAGEGLPAQKCGMGGMGGIGGKLLRHQWCPGCCGVQVAVSCGGTGSMVSVVVGVVDDGVEGGLVMCEDVVVDECVVAGVGAPPPPPLARMARPEMMSAIRITTVRPHRA